MAVERRNNPRPGYNSQGFFSPVALPPTILILANGYYALLALRTDDPTIRPSSR
jgi:hypothetical protein